MGSSRAATALAALLVLYAVKQLVLVVAFPPFTGHDEVAHYAYVRTLATEGRIPVLLRDMMPADLSPYRRFALDWPDEHPGPQYANHPPLYYALVTPLYWLSQGLAPDAQLTVLRLAAIPFGVLTVLLAYGLASAVFPGDSFMAMTVPIAVALQPQISYEAAMVNNDIVAIALSSAVLYLTIVGVRDAFPPRICVALGMTMGLALLAKATTMTAAPVVALALVLSLGYQDAGRLARRALLVVLPTCGMAAPWYLHLYRTYGNLTALPQVEALQASWNRPEGPFLSLLYNLDFVAMRFRETWGEFGWRRIPLDGALLSILAIACAVAVAGLILYAAEASITTRARQDPVYAPARWQVVALLLLAATCVVSYLAVVQFGTRFALTQARYFFPAGNAAAVLLMLGLRSWIPVRLLPYGALAVLCALCLLNIVILTQHVIPFYERW